MLLRHTKIKKHGNIFFKKTIKKNEKQNLEREIYPRGRSKVEWDWELQG